MTRRNPPARYTLPEVPQPETFRCYQVKVPDDPMHIAAFQGQIKALSRAYSWANDDDHTALLCAEAWRPIFDELCLAPDPCGVGVPLILCISGSFADDDYDFVPAIGTACSPAYVPAVGWQSCHNTVEDLEQIQLIRPFTSSTYIRHAKFRFESTTPSVPYTLSVDFYQGGVSVFHYDEFVAFGGGVTFDQDINHQSDLVLVQQLGEPGGTGILTLTDFELCYTGDFPLAQPPSQVCRFFDFTVSDGGFSVWTERPYGHWSAGGWLPDNNQVGNSSIYIGKEIDITGIITSINVTGSCQYSDGNELQYNHEFTDALNYTPGIGAFSIDSGPISWHVTAGERFLFVLLNTVHHPSNLLITSCQVCSTAPIFS